MICISEVSAQQATPAYSDVDRIFHARCLNCHAGIRPAAGLRLKTYANVIAGTKEGPVIVKGNPAESELVKRVKGISSPRMPKDGPPWLSEKEIALIENWIAAGARDTEAR
jgi:uncharacterized membrane protein